MWPKPAGRARLKGSLPVISVLHGNSLSTTVTTTGIVIDTTLFCCRKKEIFCLEGKLETFFIIYTWCHFGNFSQGQKGRSCQVQSRAGVARLV